MTAGTDPEHTDVHRRFDHGSGHYDLMVRLNPGYHRHLRAATRTLAAATAGGSVRVLDLACGSGASTRALVQALPDATTIVGVDASPGMLAQAERKTWPPRVSFRHGVVGDLDLAGLGPGEWDGVFAAYLFRNVPAERRDDAVREVFELLRPGATLVTQEYSVAGNPRAQRRWRAVSAGVIIPLAAVVDRDTALYRYLRRSVLEFDAVDAFCSRLTDAGFEQVRSSTVGGWQRGILHTVVARKPASA